MIRAMASIFDSDEFTDTLFFPRPDVTPPPDGATDAMVDVDGAQIHVRHHAATAVPAADTITTGPCALLLFHGNGEVVADYDDAAERFAAAGVSLAVADFRGYGASTGTPTLRDVIRDARPVADWLRESGASRFIVMGRSLGGMAAHELYANPVEGMIGVVLESALFDLRGLVERRGLRAPTGFSVEERTVFEPAGKLARGRLPLLVLHGERDTLIDPSEARAAYAAAGSETNAKQLVFVEGRGHNDVSLSRSYWDAVEAFVSRVTRDAS